MQVFGCMAPEASQTQERAPWRTQQNALRALKRFNLHELEQESAEHSSAPALCCSEQNINSTAEVIKSHNAKLEIFFSLSSIFRPHCI